MGLSQCEHDTWQDSKEGDLIFDKIKRMSWLENRHFKNRQPHGRSDNQLNGNTAQLNSSYHLGRKPARLHTTISTQLAFYPNAINTPHVFHPMPKVNTLSATVRYCLHIFTYCCSPHHPVASPSCGSPCHVPKPREPLQ